MTEIERPFLATKGFNTNLVLFLPPYHVIISNAHVCSFTCTISHVHGRAPYEGLIRAFGKSDNRVIIKCIQSFCGTYTEVNIKLEIIPINFAISLFYFMSRMNTSCLIILHDISRKQISELKKTVLTLFE